ncbi:MAG: TIGR04053 family radical SAM/SPASM domain-containing protein [Micromonosporaceae bacterium]|nr:TIGR04053 family radical SAM/SPASM domain-containing protein [Micromonosporaceae bacterium]
MTRVLPPQANFNERPLVVFWEVTRACRLACRHCRASAMADPARDELSPVEARSVVAQVAQFGRPYPILVLTGGDCLIRRDIFEIIEEAAALGIPVALAPSVTPKLVPDLLPRIVASGVRSVALSLDGASADTHDAVRGRAGHFAETTAAIGAMVAAGLSVKVITTVMAANVEQLADVAALVARTGAVAWEVLFLVQVGRGTAVGAITPEEHEAACHALFEAAQHDLAVRTAEAPFFRRVALQRAGGGPAPASGLYQRLSRRMAELLGPATRAVCPPTAGTRDGKGIIFVASNGTIYPAGFLPLPLGTVRSAVLRDVYRDDPLLRAIRAARFSGRCGRCDFADLCGGSRSRAFAATGDPLASDPACVHQP